MTVSDDFVENSVTAIQNSGGRVTNARLDVLKCIAEAKKPLSASGIYEMLSGRGARVKSKIDKVSVYRVLEYLVELNLVHRVSPTGDYMACFHTTCSHRHHILLRCTKCFGVKEEEIPSKVLEPVVKYIKESHGFQPDTHILQVEGVCASCRKL